VNFSRKGNVISNQKIQLYIYNNKSYQSVPVRIARPMGTNICEVGPRSKIVGHWS